MSENLKLILIVTLKNLMVLFCFTLLSIIFKKWYIVFFSLLFWTIVEKKDVNDDG